MDRINLTIDIQDNKIGRKQVNLRSSLIVANLITTIKDKFSLDGEFQIRLANSFKPLAIQSELVETGVLDGSVLIFERVAQSSGVSDVIERGRRENLSKRFKRVYLQDERTLGEYDLAWQPSVIGRRNRRDPAKNRLLAVDLDEVEDSQTVSRHHACITEKDGSFFIEGMNPNNPTFLNGRQLTPGKSYALTAGSRIQVGRLIFNFHIIS
jgi:hypothetical protein